MNAAAATASNDGMPKIGWAGVGNMGAPMLARLVAAGHAVCAYDTRPEALGATAARAVGSARELARCETVFLSLPSTDAVRLVVGEMLAARREDRADRVLKRIVNTGTTGASLSDEVVAMAAPQGVRLVECPVSGGPDGARAGQLSVMVSGAPEDVAAVRPLLECWGRITPAGAAPGAAQTLKLVNNAIIVASYVATLEAFLFGAKAGLDPHVMLEAINAGRLAPNGTTRIWLPEFILKGKALGAELQLLLKDMGLAMDEARASGVPMAVCESSLLVAVRALAGQLGAAAGLDGHADLMDLMKALEAEAGFRLPRAGQG